MTVPPHLFTGAAVMVFAVKLGENTSMFFHESEVEFQTVAHIPFVVLGLGVAVTSHLCLDAIRHVDFFSFQYIKERRYFFIPGMVVEVVVAIGMLWLFLDFIGADAKMWAWAWIGAFAGIWIDIQDVFLPDVCGLKWAQWKYLHRIHEHYHRDGRMTLVWGFANQLLAVFFSALVLWVLV